MKLLVTGGAGYVGSVCAAHLVDAGHEVVVLDDLSTGHARRGARRGAVRRGRPRARLRTRCSPTASTACCTSRPSRWSASSVQRPELYWHGNVVTTLELLDAMRRHGTPRLVFSSTAATYGEPEQVPIREDAPTRPTNPYGASKLAIDHAISSYARRARAGRDEPALLQRGRRARPLRRAARRGDPPDPARAAGGVRAAGDGPDLRRRLADPGRHLRPRLHPRRRPRRRAPAGAGPRGARRARDLQPRQRHRLLRARGGGGLPDGDRAPDPRRRSPRAGRATPRCSSRPARRRARRWAGVPRRRT